MVRQPHQNALLYQPLDEMPPAQRHALPRNHRLQDQHVIVDLQPLRHPPRLDPDRGEPVAPGGGGPVRLLQVDELVLQ